MIETDKLVIVFDYNNQELYFSIFVQKIAYYNPNDHIQFDLESEVYIYDIGKIPLLLAKDYFYHPMSEGNAKAYWMLAIARKYLTPYIKENPQ